MKMCGTLEYMSPEVLNSTQASPASGPFLKILTNMHRNANKDSLLVCKHNYLMQIGRVCPYDPPPNLAIPRVRFLPSEEP